jgi:glycosyltransferase involved in cell wall biosynthesis
MTAPKVSVVVTCFNLGAYLDEAVESVLSQTLPECEILIVDDGSTDEATRRLLTDYRRPRTTVMRTDHRGLPAARNAGAASTSGTYLCMLDADDQLEPTMIEKSVAALDNDPSIAFVSHWLRTFGDEEQDWTPTQCDLPTLLDANTLNGAAVLRRSAFQAVGGFDESMRDGCEDWDFWISLLEHGFNGRILPEILFRYRRRPASMSRVMMDGDSHPHIYARLVAKHAATYATHLESLVVRRDRERANLDLHLNDLALEAYTVIGPELAQARADLVSAEARVDARRAAHDREARALADAAALSAAEQAGADWKRQCEHAEARRAEEQVRADEMAAARDLLAGHLAAANEAHAVEIHHVQELQGRNRALVEALATVDRSLASANDALAAQTHYAEELGKRNQALDEAARALAAEATALRASWSWRVTAPLRALYEFAVPVALRRFRR